jgi:hypothetical protein
MEEITTNCLLCTKPDEEVDLIEMESNHLLCGEKTVEFSELFEELFDLKVNCVLL